MQVAFVYQGGHYRVLSHGISLVLLTSVVGTISLGPSVGTSRA
jgi:hypothetical protein